MMTKSLVDDIYNQIHEDIIANRLIPNQRLHIAQLATKYEIGPGPVREALSRLLSSGLVIAINQKGFRVASISSENLIDLYKTRAHIEALALKLSIEQGDDDWEAGIISAHHRLAKFEKEHKIVNTTDYEEWESRHRAFNLALLNACGLEHLLDIQLQLYTLTERYRRQWLLAGIEHSAGLPYSKEQKKIMDAALARDTSLGIELILNHFEKAVQIIDNYFIKNKLF